MSITLYTAPDCLRCRIVKSWLHGTNTAYDTVDFKADAAIFNAFYRANRPSIYRNPEGVEFPLFADGQVIKQGSGEIIAYLLAGRAMECCVTRSDLLHGWISGLYPSRCPAALAEQFVTLVRHLGQGGLELCLRVDGRNPALLEQLLALQLPCKVEVAVPASGLYVGEGLPTTDDLARTLTLARGTAQWEVQVVIDPVQTAQGWQWPERAAVVQAAQKLADASDKQLPCVLVPSTEPLPEGLEALTPAQMLKYRSSAREFLFKATCE